MDQVSVDKLDGKIEIILDRLAEHVSQCHEHWKQDAMISERLIKVETLISQIEWREINNLSNRVSNLEQLKNGWWKVLAPVISSMIGGVIVWIASRLMTP